jgi:nicotinic acid mononucleotide adenylyltransferase
VVAVLVAAAAAVGPVNEKIERDPFLREVCRRWGPDAVEEAGFFFDADDEDAPLDDVGWLCTPTEVVRRGVARLRSEQPGGAPRSGRRAAPPVVLLSTGGFFPVHRGHLEMMERARDAATAAGWSVVGGYVSPAHDDYIRLKCGSVPVGVSQRLARAEQAIAATGWLSIDPWEALGRRVAVNYTDVTARLEAYLRAHVDDEIEVAFVCGGDNARFALAFAALGRAIVVGRPGSEQEVARWRGDPRVRPNRAILWAEGVEPGASRDLRPVRWPEEDAARLSLRLEDPRAVATLGLGAASWRTFQVAVQRELGALVPLETVRVEPRSVANETRTISLDPMLPGTVDLGVSRLFDLGGHRPHGHVARPDDEPVDVQCARIPAGEWTLRDDDRATGSTVDFVASRLRADVVLVATTFVVDPRERVDLEGGPSAGRVEIADSRDFLLGADHGGLVVALPDGSVGRAPYLLPYVDPAVRCGLPATVARSLSLALWQAQAEVFASTTLCVHDLPGPAQRTMRLAGHAPGARLADVCRHHAAVLARLAPLPPVTPTPSGGAPAGSSPARA